MPQVNVYVDDELYVKLIEAGDKSTVVQKALRKYFKMGEKQ